MPKKPPIDIPPQWSIVASMPDIRAAHPGWTEDQCREEFGRQSTAALKEKVEGTPKKREQAKAAKNPPKPKKSDKLVRRTKKPDPVAGPSSGKKGSKAPAPDKSTSEIPPGIAGRRRRRSGGIASPARTEHGITEQQEQFCHSYCKHLSAMRAYREAGYSDKGLNAETNSYRLLANPLVKSRIEKLKHENIDRVRNELEHALDNDKILRELAYMAYVDTGKFMSVTAGGEAYIDIARVMEEEPDQLRGLETLEIVDMAPVIEFEGGEVTHREVLKTKFKTNKLKALELLMKHKNLFKEDRTMSLDDLDKLIQRQEADLRQREAMLESRNARALAQPAIEGEYVDETEPE